MGNTIQIPTISHLPDQDTGWVANEFKEYNKQKREVVQTFKTLDRLGKGGFGAVYKVQETITGKIYALKYIPSDAWEVAKKEAVLMMSLQHPTIVKVHCFFPLYDPKYTERIIAFCIVMDFVEGQNLRDAMHNASESIPKTLVMEWFIKILEALNYLHERKIFHRDIKPENIIIKMDGAKFDVVLVDFGLAMQGSHLGQTQITVAGTFPYLSPDLLTSGGRAPLNGKADIWALGCILYEIWTQDSSFVLKPMGMAGRFMADPNLLEKLDDVSISQILSYMLRTDPNERISASELLSTECIKGWQAAIDASHPDRNNCPRSAVALLPYLSIVKDKSAPINHCLANLVFISRWQKIQDFQRVLIDFNLASTLINLMDHYSASSQPKSSTLPLFAMCSKILTALISNVLGDFVAYQICSNPVGIQVLLRSNVFDVVLRLLHINFGFSTLRNQFALEHYIYELMFSGTDEQIRGAVVLYEDLPSSSIPLIVYLNTFVKYVKEPAKQVRNITDLLYNHEDIVHMLTDTIAYNKIKEVITGAVYSQSEYIDRLLGAILRVILPRPQIPYKECINHRICTSNITGVHKYYQYMWVCRSCNTSVCFACAKRCHGMCKGDFISAVARCRCTGILKQSCECLVVNDINGVGNNAEMSCRLRGGVANFSFMPNKDVLLPPPHDGIIVGSLLRFWEGSQELKLPPYSVDKNEPKHFFRNKGMHFTPIQNNNVLLSTTFYYEVEILAPAIGPNASVAVGITLRESPPKDNEMVGWNSGWAYHGDDGKRLCGKKKGVPYGPIFCTGDRIGCGVFSDGTVFFTINGQFIGPFPPEEPRVPMQARVFSTVSVCGFDAHVKFYFDIASFMFCPTSSFEPVNFFKNLPLLYTNVNLLRDTFGPNNRKVFDLLSTVDCDLAAILLNALVVGNPGLIAELKSHPLYEKLVNSTVFATTVILVGVRDVYGDQLHFKRITKSSSADRSMLNLKNFDKSDTMSTDAAFNRSPPSGVFNQQLQGGPSNNFGLTNSSGNPNRYSAHASLNKRSPRDNSSYFDVNFNNYPNVENGGQQPPSPKQYDFAPSFPSLMAHQQYHSSSSSSSSGGSSSASPFQHPAPSSSPFSQQPSSSPSPFSPTLSNSWGMDATNPRLSFSASPAVVPPVLLSPTGASPSPYNGHAGPNIEQLHAMEQMWKLMNISSSIPSSPMASLVPLTLHVMMAGGDSDDLRELVLANDQLTIKGITAALCELFDDIFPEGRAISKIVKEVNSNGSNSPTQVKLGADKNIQLLKQNDRIIVHFV